MAKRLGSAPGYFVLIASLLLLGCEKEKPTLFTALAPTESGIDFVNQIEETAEVNILTYEYTYNGGGVAAADFNNDGLCDLYFTGNTVGNRLYLNKGELRFRDVTEKAAVGGRSLWKTGVTTADVNGDGRMDIYVCYSGPDVHQSLSNELYINNGGDVPSFTERAAEFGLDAPGTYSTQAAFFDYDRDGDLDMFLINHGNHFYAPFINTRKLRNTRHPSFGNRLYRHDVTGTKHLFTDVSETAGIQGGGINFGLGLSISDVNGDGWPDVYVTNDYEEQDFFYLNHKDGKFVEVTGQAFDHLSRNGMGTDLADFNNDARPDLIEVDMWPEDNYRQKLLKGPDDYYRYQLMLDSGFRHQQMRNVLQLNTGVTADGVPIFSEIGQLAGVATTDWSWAPLFADVDNDGWKDLFITNGYLRDFTSMDFLKYTVEDAKKEAVQKGEPLKLFELVSKMSSTKTADYIFKNNGDNTFSDFSKEWGVNRPNLSFGATYADLDNDGDLELITNNTNESAVIWQNHANETSKNSFLRIQLKGQPGNNFGIGAKVFVETDKVTQYNEVFTTRGFQSSVEPTLNFGLTGLGEIRKVRVMWPDGKENEIMNPPSNAALSIAWSDGGDATPKGSAVTPRLFTDITKSSAVDFTHRENRFVDFDIQPLLPYQLSRSGPALAAGDVDADGNDDFFIGGAAGQAGVLFLSDGQGKFIRAKAQPWKADAASEDTGATFFDFDGDHDLDLFVVSGGNEFETGSKELDDRLYINRGKGEFVKAASGLTPEDHVSGSCVTASDFDKDGDVDLFIGGRAMPGKFPLASPSAVLRNEGANTGTDRLVLATIEVNASLREIGMVTDATWADFDNDSWLDLVIVGEWMPIRMFRNESGKLTEVQSDELANAPGLWNRIMPVDIDNDGDVDFVVGNAGDNLTWHPTTVEPLSLTYGDFNQDGRIDPIICGFIQGKSFPIASRDELLLQMTSLRKKFITYDAYAKATMEDLISSSQLSASKKLSVTTFHNSIVENLGGGQFRLKALPREAQVSSVRGILADDLNGDHVTDILVAGNFYSFRTQYGPSDAGKGLLLKGKNGQFISSGGEATGFLAPGDVRNMVELRTKSGRRFLVLGRNNDSAMVFQIMAPVD